MCPESVKAKYRFKVLQSKSAPATMGGVQLANAKEEQLRIEQLVTSTPHAASGQEAQISYVSESLQSLRPRCTVPPHDGEQRGDAIPAQLQLSSCQYV